LTHTVGTWPGGQCDMRPSRIINDYNTHLCLHLHIETEQRD